MLSGIYLGRTNSVAAVCLEQVEVVTAEDNSPPDRCLTRSVVAFKNHQPIVGEEAYYRLKYEPENAIIEIQDLMGRKFNDPIVQHQISRVGYQIIPSSQNSKNDLAVLLGGKEYSPEDISAEIIKKVVKNAQNYREKVGDKRKITHAVITVPAYFNDKQREASQRAATKAGLMNFILPEPVAGAISYGFQPNSEDIKSILVYNFGDGKFESCLIFALDNEFRESGKAEDLWLGEDDIDNQIIELVKEKVAQQEDLDSVDLLLEEMPHYQRVRFLEALKLYVERAKIDLSRYDRAQIAPSPPLLDDLGMAIHIDVEITRSEFEAMILPMVERTINIARDALKYSEWSEADVDAVLMVGGSSQIPLVQQKVREAFGEEKVVIHPRPMYAFAEGAAILASGLAEIISIEDQSLFSQQPKATDAVLGGQTTPQRGLVLGGVEGLRQRLENVDQQARLVALQQTVDYGEKGLKLLEEAIVEDKLKLAKNLETSVQILQLLAQDEDYWVRIEANRALRKRGLK